MKKREGILLPTKSKVLNNPAVRIHDNREYDCYVAYCESDSKVVGEPKRNAEKLIPDEEFPLFLHLEFCKYTYKFYVRCKKDMYTDYYVEFAETKNYVNVEGE